MKQSFFSVSFYFIGIFILSLLFFFPFWISWHYGDVTLDQLLFHINTPWSGLNPKLLLLIIKEWFFLSITLTALFFFIPFLGSKKLRLWINQHIKLFFFLFFLCVIWSFNYNFNLVRWYNQIFGKPTSFYEENYVYPEKLKIAFPQQKRNIIYIMVESMETTFSIVGNKKSNLIPDLQNLAEENITFKGYYPSVGTQWTSASMVAGLCGFPLKSLSTKTVQFSTFLPKVKSLTDILKENGYQNIFMMGSDANYANKKVFLKDHGFDEIIDFPIGKRNSTPSSMFGSEWGLKDQVLFEQAKQKLISLSKTNTPFFMGILTLDMHPPEGYLDPHCPIIDDDYFNNVVYCTNLLVTDFVKWVQSQPFSENTTIVIVGDHFAWGADKYKEKRALLEKNTREVINIIINPIKSPIRTERKWAMYDMAPTVLESIGAEIPGHRFGLGTSLFSEEPTLLEKYPPQEVDILIESKSHLYQTLCGIKE